MNTGDVFPADFLAALEAYKREKQAEALELQRQIIDLGVKACASARVAERAIDTLAAIRDDVTSLEDAQRLCAEAMRDMAALLEEQM